MPGGLVKVAVYGSVGKAVFIDTSVPARVTELERQLALIGTSTGVRHSSLSGLQVGDDHPQYAMWQAAEQITGLWNFATEPHIESITLTEFIQDTVGMDLVENTTSVTWTYTDAAATLEANVVPEFIEDTVGAMLTDTASVDLVYNDGTGQITANVIPEFIQDTVGAMLTDSSSIDFTYDDTAGTFTAAVIDAYIKGITVSRYVRGASWYNTSGVDAGTANTVYVRVPVTGTIAKATLLTAGGTGSCVVDVRKGTYAGFPTTASIAAAAKPTITSAIKYESTALTGWTTAVTAGDILAFVLDSSSTFTQISIELEIQV